MKVSTSIEKLYNSKVDDYIILKELADGKIPNLIKPTYHYDGRVKTLESFAQKVETSRFDANEIFEDMFACRIVVDNINEVNNVKKIIKETFVCITTKPMSNKSTHKKPEEFPFDDLRIYCKWTDNPKRESEERIKNLVFEIQIKTYLQHAWGIATHSLIYKGNEVNWRLHRVAYQVKAILEHAEVSIGNAEELSKTELLPKENRLFKQYEQIRKVLVKYWDEENLPNDMSRLIQNISSLLDATNTRIDEYKKILNKSIGGNGKITIKNLSPYYASIQLFNDYAENKLVSFFNQKNKFISINELELCELIDRQINPSNYIEIDKKKENQNKFKNKYKLAKEKKKNRRRGR